MKKLLWVFFAVAVMGTISGCTIDNTYAVCNTDAGCNDRRDRCFGVSIPTAGTSGNFCSRACSTHSDCESNFGFSGACYEIGGSGAQLCHQQCAVDADCYSSSVCIQLTLTTGGTDFVCVPDN